METGPNPGATIEANKGNKRELPRITKVLPENTPKAAEQGMEPSGMIDDAELLQEEPVEFAKGSNPSIPVPDVMLSPAKIQARRDFSSLPPLPEIGKKRDLAPVSGIIRNRTKLVDQNIENLRLKLRQNQEIKRQQEDARNLAEVRKLTSNYPSMENAAATQNPSTSVADTANFLKQNSEFLNQPNRKELEKISFEAQSNYVAAYRRFFRLTSRVDRARPKEFVSDHDILLQPLRIPLLRRFSGDAKNLRELHEAVVKTGEALEAAGENN